MKSNNLRIIENNGVKYIEYSFFDKLDFVNTIGSTRYGGVSNGRDNYSMNLGFATVDAKENVYRNYEIFADAVGLNCDNIVTSSQFHNDNIRVCTMSDGGKGITKTRDFQDIDALITNEKGLTLTVFSADCVPVLFADKVSHSIGAAHCGWRGTFKSLAAKTAQKMIDEFNADRDNIHVTIGVSIKKCCYEVSEELYNDFIDKFPYINDGECAEIINNKYYLDLPLINKKILIDYGIKEENIFIADMCTCCNKEHLFSHRGQGSGRGIMASMITIK